MMLRYRRLGLLLLVALGGCASQRAVVSEAPAMQGRTIPVELVDIPFFPQEELQCGPAALATVLGAAGVDATPEQLAAEVFTPGLAGSLQLELVAAARSRGLVPYLLPPTPDAIFAELLAGRPVLVLQNLRLRSLPAWHYAVVIGADPRTEQLVLRSGTEERLVLPSGKFLGSWDLADRWGLVLLRPGALPANPDRDRYFEAVAGLEAVGRHAAAARAWEAALRVWPEDDVGLFGFATASHLAGHLPAAYDAYAGLIRRRPDHAAALNNLAHLLAAQGCPRAARVLAERALGAAPAGSVMAGAAEGTLRQLRANAPEGSACVLP
jgi:tetratricopeptide (TPR) repeat protein